jgi:hypothetical protein
MICYGKEAKILEYTQKAQATKNLPKLSLIQNFQMHPA